MAALARVLSRAFLATMRTFLLAIVVMIFSGPAFAVEPT